MSAVMPPRRCGAALDCVARPEETGSSCPPTVRYLASLDRRDPEVRRQHHRPPEQLSHRPGPDGESQVPGPAKSMPARRGTSHVYHVPAQTLPPNQGTKPCRAQHGARAPLESQPQHLAAPAPRAPVRAPSKPPRQLARSRASPPSPRLENGLSKVATRADGPRTAGGGGAHAVVSARARGPPARRRKRRESVCGARGSSQRTDGDSVLRRRDVCVAPGRAACRISTPDVGGIPYHRTRGLVILSKPGRRGGVRDRSRGLSGLRL